MNCITSIAYYYLDSRILKVGYYQYQTIQVSSHQKAQESPQELIQEELPNLVAVFLI